MQNKFRWSAAVIFAFSVVLLGFLVQEIQTLKRKNKQYSRFFSNLEKGQGAGLRLELSTLPAALQEIPFADEQGIVIDEKRVSIRNVYAPHNASIIEDGDGYLLFFRYDMTNPSGRRPYSSYVGCTRLDANFQQTEEEFTRIETGSESVEDPRVIRVGGSLYLTFNDVQPCGILCRTMRIGRVNVEESKLDYVTNLDMQIKSVEKNWAPFEYIEEGKPFVCLEYYITPHKILKLENPSVSQLIHMPSPASATYQKLNWPPVWGALKGGTPARKVGDQYMSFFHSFFNDSNGIVWYVMGAYTFEEQPPFRVTSLSHHPILFKTIYDTPPINTAEAYKRVIFPGGFLPAIRNGKEVIHLVCGENDCAIKIITFDKNALLSSLKKV